MAKKTQTETKTKFSFVSGENIIAEVVRKYPGADEILMDFGIGCFRCGVAEFETLEQGILGHGFTEDELNMVLSDLNELAEELEKELKKKK